MDEAERNVRGCMEEKDREGPKRGRGQKISVRMNEMMWEDLRWSAGRAMEVSKANKQGRKLREEKIATEGVYPCSTFPVARDDIESGNGLAAFRGIRGKNV